jgi:hypothetical protein
MYAVGARSGNGYTVKYQLLVGEKCIPTALKTSPTMTLKITSKYPKT